MERLLPLIQESSWSVRELCLVWKSRVFDSSWPCNSCQQQILLWRRAVQTAVLQLILVHAFLPNCRTSHLSYLNILFLSHHFWINPYHSVFLTKLVLTSYEVACIVLKKIQNVTVNKYKTFTQSKLCVHFIYNN